METTIRKNNGQITPIVHLKVPILYSLLFTSFSRVDGTKELDFSEEKDLFIKLCFFIDTIHRCDTTDVNYAIIFKSNNLNYRSYTSQDYLDIFNYFSREISDVFNMNENILVKSVLSLTSMIPCSCMGTISIEDFRKIENYFHANLSQFIVDSGVFFNSLHNDDVYINNLEQLMLGKIGISVDDLIYIPNSNFMLSNIFDVLFKNKNLGHKFEALIDNEIKKLHYFDKCFCRYYLNKNSQNEHDLLYINTQNKDCLIVECKSSKKHVIFASEEKGHNRLKQEYVEVIKKGFDQCNDVKNKMLTGKTALYDENKKSIGELDIRNYQILELVITLDDFLRADQIFTDNLKDNKTYGSILLMNFADLRKAMGLCKGEKFFEFLNFCERFNGLTTTDGGYLLLLSNFLETNNYYDDYTSADKYDERQYANLEKQLRNVQKSGCSSNQVDGGSS